MAELIRWNEGGAALVAQAIDAGPDMGVAQYQDAVHTQLAGVAGMDAGPETIRGRDAEAYLHDGVVEEFGETFEVDDTDYDRGAALRRPQWEDRLPSTDERVLLHAKEFGDLSWYTTNLLTVRGMRLTGAIGVPGFLNVRQLDRVAFGYAAMYAPLFTDPAKFYFDSAEQLIDHSRQLLNRHNQDNAAQFYHSAGRVVVAMSALLQLRLDTSWAAVTLGNLAKVEGRHRKGNIFGNGDSR
jgi:hypothetical protein